MGTAGTEGDNLFALQGSMKLQDLVTPAARGRVEIGEPLIFKNVAYTFHQLDASWLSFRPDLAAILGWRPDSTRPGSWHTSAGDLAVQTIWWVDGWGGTPDSHSMTLKLRGMRSSSHHAERGMFLLHSAR